MKRFRKAYSSSSKFDWIRQHVLYGWLYFLRKSVVVFNNNRCLSPSWRKTTTFSTFYIVIASFKSLYAPFFFTWGTQMNKYLDSSFVFIFICRAGCISKESKRRENNGLFYCCFILDFTAVLCHFLISRTMLIGDIVEILFRWFLNPFIDSIYLDQTTFRKSVEQHNYFRSSSI